MNDLSDVLDRKGVTQGLTAIAWQVRRWLDWHKSHRDKEMLVTDDDTHIMGLPVPFWPSHGQFEAWIKTMNDATAEIDDLLTALRKIEKWSGEFPITAERWPDGSPVSYAALYGSNGERDFMRGVARAAIAKAEGRNPPDSLRVDGSEK
jgi:hypothetical protein